MGARIMTAAGRRGALAFLALGGLVLLLACSPGSAHAAEGSLDRSFGEAGWASAPPGVLEGPAEGVEIGVGPDGSADVADGASSVVRFTAAGARDYGFGEGGVLDIREDPAAEGVAARSLAVHSIAVDGEGRLLVFGTEDDSRRTFDPHLVTGSVLPSSRAAVLRYDPEGKPDPSFGGGGFVTGAFGLGPGPRSAFPFVSTIRGTVDSQNRPVLLAGVAGIGSSCIAHAGATYLPAGIVRLTEAGEPDPSFGDDGTAKLEGTESSLALGVDAADRPVAEVGPVGNARQRCRPTTTLIHLGTDGSRLARFGRGGAVRLRGWGLGLVEPSGPLLVERFEGRRLELARMTIRGGRDSGFGEGGVAKILLPPGAAYQVRPVAVDGAGRILLVGFLGRRHSALVVGRLLPDGSLDTSFGEGGWIVAPVAAPFRIESTAAALDPEGRLLVAAAGAGRPEASGNGYLLARFLLGPSA
jgi:uncharacterized delta-60 repeat protein